VAKLSALRNGRRYLPPCSNWYRDISLAHTCMIRPKVKSLGITARQNGKWQVFLN